MKRLFGTRALCKINSQHVLLGDINMRGPKNFTIVCSVLVLFSLTVTAWAVPPKVVEIVPENGAQNVDPKLTQIRVVFDQDMSSRGYSVCGGRPKFPKMTGRPRCVDKRTLIMTVTLLAGHEYQFSINCPSAQNCRSVRGEPVVPYPVRFKTGSGKESAPAKILTAAENEEAIKQLRRGIDEQYSYRDIRKVDWDKLFREKGDALRRAESAERFATVAGELLANAKDKHIWLYAGEQRFGSYVNPVTPNVNFSRLKALIPGWQKRSAAVFSGRFIDGIGYIYISDWEGDHAEALEQTYVAIWEFSDAPGLVVDVRTNGGGSEPLAEDFAGCFVDAPKVYAQHVYRAANEPGGFTKPHNRVLEPNKRRPKYRGKVAVLMGPANMSSCEAFLLMMKQVPGCKLIGATSQGSSGNPKPTELGNGVTVYLPSWKAMRPDGSCFEGEGIAPDIVVEVTQSQLSSRDPVLEAALKFLRER
jgi:hypothetical protein